MSWSSQQIQLAAMACRGIDLTDDQRRMILSGPVFGNRAMHQGRITSRSPRLTNEDFELFMAFVEAQPDGQLRIFAKDPTDGQQRFRYPMSHWRNAAERGPIQRMRNLVRDLNACLCDQRTQWLPPGAAPEQSLRAWIRRQTTDRTDRVEELDLVELQHLVEGLKAFARRNGVRLDRRAS